MNLPSFDEFTKSLTPDDIDYINGINDESSSLKLNLSDPNSLNELSAYINGKSFGMTLRLLQLYHEWLSELL